MTEKKQGVLDWFSDRLNLTEIFSLLTSYGLFYAEVDTRKPLRAALDEALARPLPSYARWPRVLGLLVVVVLGLEVVTGGLLTLYYLPTPESAHASLGTILRDVQFGWFVHQIHFWGAQLLIALLLIRVLRFFVQRVYRAPRELVWLFAALLLLVCFHLDLTGRALPMTAGAYWSSIRALELMQQIPIYGAVVLFLVGGDVSALSELTLIRFYVLHVAVLPVLAISLIYLHFSCVRRVGLSERVGERKRTGHAALKGHLANLAIVLTIVFGVLVTLAVLSPLPFQTEADPYATPPGVGPPWYLLALFGFMELTAGFLPTWLAGGFLFLCFTAFLALPFILPADGSPRRRRLLIAAAGVAVAGWVALTLYGGRVA